MSNLVLLGLCFVLGIIFRKSNRFPENTSQVLNAFILHVSLPALVFRHIHEIQFSSTILLPALMPWILFSIATLFFLTLHKLGRVTRKTAICLALTAGLGNTSFVGLPLLESYLGEQSLGYGIIADQMGTFLALSFPGMILANLAHEEKFNAQILAKRVITFAPLIALILAVLLRPLSFPEWLNQVLVRLGDTLAPLALVSVGFLLNLRTLKGHRSLLFLGLSFKLILLPMTIILIYKFITPNRLLFETIVLEAGMAPMVTSTIVAIEKDIAPHLASLMLGIGIPTSFLTTYGLLYLLNAGII
jgi:predicted permease